MEAARAQCAALPGAHLRPLGWVPGWLQPWLVAHQELQDLSLASLTWL